MSTISVRDHFAAGHRILGLSGEGARCRNPHGHTFHITWTFQQDDELEFGRLKNLLKSLVKHHFDHSFILDKTDDFKTYFQANMLNYYLLDGPPTTERIAAEIARLSIDALHLPWNEHSHRPDRNGKAPIYPNASLLRVSLDEGPNNNATWEQDSVDLLLANPDLDSYSRDYFEKMKAAQK